MSIKDVTAFAKGSGATVDNIESIDRKHNLKTKVASVPHNNGITAAFLTNDKPAIANNQARQHSSALVAQLNRHQCRRWIRQNWDAALPRDRASYRTNSSLVIVIDSGGGKGMIEIRALKRDGSNQRNPLFSPFRAEARMIRRSAGKSRRFPSSSSCARFNCLGRRARYLARCKNEQDRHRQKRTPIFHTVVTIGTIRA
jgi:hypothetical protein